MIRTLKPKNARSKRAVDEREPKLIENPKKALFLRGTSTSELIQTAFTDLNSLKKPRTIKFSKKNAIHPFEDNTALEFFSRKNDASLVVFASHSKKRPHNLLFARTFDHRILDMYELGIEAGTFRSLTAFKNSKCAIGMKPMLAFSGSVFASVPRYQNIKNMFLDFFHGETVKGVDVEGLQYMVQLSAADPIKTNPDPKVHLRVYLIKTKKSGRRLPRVEVEEIGPRIDFDIRRIQEANHDVIKEALKRPKVLQSKVKKNIATDPMGDKIGLIHTGKQDMNKLQSRKMKGLKKRDREDGYKIVADKEVRPKRLRSE